MAEKLPEWKMGIEEELFMVDRETKALVSQLPEAYLAACEKAFPGQIVTEFLSSQIELVTRPHSNLRLLKEELATLRRFVIEQAKPFGLAPVAVSTHPFSFWHQQKPNPLLRYQKLRNRLQISAHRMLVGGMHIHFEVKDEEKRLTSLNHLGRYLPILLSLSTSSPFWLGVDSGLNSFRISVIDGLPRSGIPPYFENYAEYQRYIATLVSNQIIDDATEIWWDARISARYPTVEMRISDACPKLTDVMAIASLYLCMMLVGLQREPLAPDQLRLDQLITEQNRWQVQRYPIQQMRLITPDRNSIEGPDLFKGLLENYQAFAKVLECEAQLSHILTIVNDGTSADRQRALFQKATQEGHSDREALIQVVESLILETADI